ncbi:MAG: hypothetical protein PVS2B2_05440 [Candidatus Acidiferrum sp.]
MADWKQITARIRRARTSKDPAAQLSNLYEKTHDAMAAFELARYFETTGLSADAGKWYATAAGRFRRSDWKTKAQEAAVRLGATVPEEIPLQRGDDFHLTPPPMVLSESAEPPEPSVEIFETVSPAEVAPAVTPIPAASAAILRSEEKRPRRRGRRGGRNRRKPGTAGQAAPGATERSTAETVPAIPAVHRKAPETSAQEDDDSRPTRAGHGRAMPPLPLEPISDANIPGLRGRYGDPGLSSRLTQLEMHFRRLLTCAPARLGEGDQAPVGPGVFVLTDSDLTTYYYVEACQTLRIAIGNLIRGGSSRRGVDSLKPQLAEHLGIPEARVTKYLADHCVVRWLQLDEGASHFAHFVIAVLRPKLNE